MRKAIITTAAGIYAAGAIFTFGVVWNRIECPVGGTGWEWQCQDDARVISAVLMSVAWPLALSAVAQEAKR